MATVVKYTAAIFFLTLDCLQSFSSVLCHCSFMSLLLLCRVDVYTLLILLAVLKSLKAFCFTVFFSCIIVTSQVFTIYNCVPYHCFFAMMFFSVFMFSLPSFLSSRLIFYYFVLLLLLLLFLCPSCVNAVLC